MTDRNAQEHIPYVHLADAAAQDHSIADRQFPGLHNDTSYIWAMAESHAEQGGPVPTACWSTMEVIRIRATPRD